MIASFPLCFTAATRGGYCRAALSASVSAYGNAGRNVLNLPSRTNFDMGLFKNFAIKEAMHFEFRAEAFNVFNHTQWNAIDPNACYGAQACSTSTFLTAIGAHNARILQLAGKFVF